MKYNSSGNVGWKVIYWYIQQFYCENNVYESDNRENMEWMGINMRNIGYYVIGGWLEGHGICEHKSE